MSSAMELDSIQSDQEFQRQYPGAPDWALGFFNKMSDMTTRLERVEAKIDITREVAIEAQKRSVDNTTRTDELEQRIQQLERQMQVQEDYSRRSNLRIEGIPEAQNPDGEFEELYQVVQKLFHDELQLEGDIRLERCHRLGKTPSSSKNRPRPILIRFSWFQDRIRVWNSKKKLKGSRVVIREDFSHETEKNRKLMYQYFKAAKIRGVKKVSLRGDVLNIDGQSFTVNTASRIPNEYHPSANATLQNEQVIIFHGRESPFSNFYQAKFQVGDHEYTDNEMFYQSRKAEYFNDEHLAAKIRAAKDPLDSYKLGWRVKGFNEKRWAAAEQGVMFDGAIAKFSQNPNLRQQLLSTDEKILAESSSDMRWATGLPLHHASAFDQSSWRGENNLGKVLMLVRDRIK